MGRQPKSEERETAGMHSFLRYSAVREGEK